VLTIRADGGVVAGLRVGSRLDARLPLTDGWAPARVVSIAPAPFSHWFRVSFDGLGLEWWRWVSWEGAGPFVGSCSDADAEPVAAGDRCVCVLHPSA
jgi:hypothetical protein